MTERESNLRSVLFLVIGILLLLSLVICVFIIKGESDLVKTESQVINVKKDVDGTGKNNVDVIYEAGGTDYAYTLTYREDVNVGDKITIYYHKNDQDTVQLNKTSKLIFICPLFGLILCVVGLYELFKKNTDGEEEFKTSVIGVVGNTQQLKIVTKDTPAKEYEKTPEEAAEAEVKAIKRDIVAEASAAANEEKPKMVSDVANVSLLAPQVPASLEVKTPKETTPEYVPEVEKEEEMPIAKESESEVEVPEVTNVAKPEVATKLEVEEEIIPSDVVAKVASSVNENKGTTEEDIKRLIKDVLKETISEIQEEKKEEVHEPVVQVRVLPNYYYISGTSLIYEESGKDAKELNLKDIYNVVRTINSEGNVVKLVVESPSVKCILTNMKNIDLEQVANLLHNKLRTMDDSFNEVIEHKEY